MATPIRIPHFLGGISRQPMSQRLPSMVEDAVNVTLDPIRGLGKRPGTMPVAALDVLEPTQDKMFHWIDRDEDEQFLMIVDPAHGDSAVEVIQMFDLSDGSEVPVDYDSDDPRPYLTAGTLPLDQRYRALQIADGILLVNRDVETARNGAALTYIANSENLRNRTNANNLPTWDDFPHPPTGTAAEGVVDSDHLYYAREDAPNLPQGFYRASSTTQPPWYQRIRTEPANSEMDETTLPIRLDYDGTSFTASYADWRSRLAGDDLTNPGPPFIGQPISDMIIHQNRLMLASGERVASSRLNDLLNLWRNSDQIYTDSDPVEVPLSENRVNNIDHMILYANSVMLFTRANNQFQIMSQGPFSFSTVSLRPVGRYNSVPYARPIAMQDSIYFLSERNFTNHLWQYRYDPERGDQFRDLSAHAEELIPATARKLIASERHGKLFILTRAEPHALYINEQGSWYRWLLDEGDEILDAETFGDELFMVIRRDGMLWLEKVFIALAPQDIFEVETDVFKTMGYSVLLDRRQEVQGVYDVGTNTTSWTLPYLDPLSSTLVLGPNWDTDDSDPVQRLAGLILEVDVTEESGVTVLVAEGKYDVNDAGEPSPVYIGRDYEMRVKLSQLFVRDEEGHARFGNTTLLGGRLRFKDTAYFRVDVTPHKRFTRSVEYLFPRVGSTALDGIFVQPQGSLYFRLLGRAADMTIEIVNDRPVPSFLIDGTIDSKFMPESKSPTD